MNGVSAAQRSRSALPWCLRAWARSLALLATTLLASSCAIPRWPVRGPMTSAFGVRWSGFFPDIHRGVDIAVPDGTEVRVMAPGRVRFAGEMSGFGNVVWVDHRGDVLTVYAHLSEIRVRQGESLDGGTVLGLSGQTGNAQSPHLHFEVWRWGRERDPVPLLGGRPE